MGVRKGPVEDLIDRAGGCAVIDGGFATQLELEGADITDPLWSAVCLISDPDLIRRVHLQYLEAGADIIVTSSYQVRSLGYHPGVSVEGLSIEAGERLLQRSVQLALEARDRFWKAHLRAPRRSYHRALVAASVGSYGAYLADGSEYSGRYGPDVGLEKLKDFHRRRLQIFVGAGPDMLAFETIPNKIEAQALVELLDEEQIQIPSLICFSSVDGEHVCSGESFADCLEIVNKSEKVAAVGLNCHTDKLIAVYPNSGEIWDGRAKKWLPSECYGDEKFTALAKRWRECGASLVGGCCRTTPSTIRSLSAALKSGPPLS
ncbi:unnamed protein product [Spirodela intermedia]|uniref:homocysteine S-methyltransferase n=1 Tax=Spirodela intermedia TaxID=51605 RepID=A0A7I8J3K4_SPIIN|nr:unnamed protein product [Spirodela intermedia]CAA6664826.1 unnamed protein product [Spirodela intermedia]